MPGTIGANVHVDDVELRSNNIPGGRLITEYEVSTIYDVRNLKQVARYVVTCRQRIIIANETAGQYNDQQPTSYENYPILMTNVIEPKKLKSRAEIEQEVKDGIDRIKDLLNKRLEVAIEPEELEEDADRIFDFWSELDRHDCQLQDYSPRTIDTSVSSNLSGNDSASQSSSIQHTLGSSISQTNTHSTSHTHIWKPFGGSKTTSNDKSIGADLDGSLGSGQTAEDDQQSGLADSMSLKTWGAYASINTENTGVSWAWGQEYPWNIFYFNAQGSNPTGDINLPDYVVDRMYNEPFVLPPSDLSLFGLDFISVARWIITSLEPEAFGDKMKFDTDLSVYLASHGLVPSTSGGKSTFLASLNLDPDTATHRSKTLNLTLLGLVPIYGEGGRRRRRGRLQSEPLHRAPV